MDSSFLLSAGAYAKWLLRAGYGHVRARYTSTREHAGQSSIPKSKPLPSLRRSLSGTFVGGNAIVVTADRVALRSPRRRQIASRPRVSIGVPVHNGEMYLRQALSSVRAQDFDDYEVIICDNSSTDSTESICRDFVDQDERFHYYRQPRNMGAAFNYNDCFRRSNGEYFTWLAHDDVRAPSFLRGCLEELDEATDPVVLVYGATDFIDHEGRIIARDSHSVDARDPRPSSRFGKVVTDTGAVNAIFGLIDARALEQTRLIGPFMASDRVLLAELAMLGEIHEIAEVLALRRIHRGTSTIANPGKRARTLWFAPEARVPRLPHAQLLAFEYSRSVLRMGMGAGDVVSCLAMVPLRMAPRYGRIAIGRFKRRILQEPASSVQARIGAGAT